MALANPSPTLAQRIEGGLVGLLIGDALGVPYEFKKAHELPSVADLEFEPPAWFPRSHDQVRPGTWSDDGAQALCLLDSLLHQGRFDAEDFGRRLVNWRDWGHMAVGGAVFDVGFTTERAVRALRSGVPALEAGERDEHSNGNGALMRVLPLALWHRGTDHDLVRDARLSSMVTHGHPRSQLCCALYCLWVRRILERDPHPWRSARNTFHALTTDDAAAHAEIETVIQPDLVPETPGSGYVVDTLRSARMLAEQPNYERVVKAAVALGDDTDTTAAVAGGAAGVQYGVQGIPRRWRDALRGRDLLEPLLQQLLSIRQGE